MNGTRHTWFTVLIACTIFGQDFSALAQEGPAGITVPRVFPPFDRNVARCDTPPSLNKALGFAQDNEREFIQGIARGLAMAAKDRGLAFTVSIANNDAARMIEQVEGFRSARAGGLVVAPVDPASLAPALRRMIWKGAYVGAVVPPPATSLLNAPQYLTGKTLGGRGRLLYSGQARRQGQCRAADARQPAIPLATLCSNARFAKRYPRCGDRRRYFPAHCE